MELKNLHQNIFSYLLDYTSLLFLVTINLFSLILLLFLSPVLGMLWLLLLTLFFLLKGEYKNIFLSWGIFFSSWYLFFIVFFLGFGSQILIGDEHLLKIMIYLCDKFSIYKAPWYIKPFEGFCFQTVILLNYLSIKLGFPVYVPSLINFFISFIKYLFEGWSGKGSAKCAGQENFKAKTAASEHKGYEDMKACSSFKKELEKSWSFVKSKEGVSGDRFVYYREIYIPFVDTFTGCGSRSATEEEIRDHKKKFEV